MVGVKYIASVSFGKDSLAMLLRLLAENKPLDAVVFYDTGMEFDAIYRIRDRIIPYLELFRIEYVELHPDEPFLYSMFDREVKYRNKEGHHCGFGWCGGVCRWGTSQKTAAIHRYKKSLSEPVTDYVGIAADEPDRFDKAQSENKVLPLVDWGMEESDCLSFCRARGWEWTEQTTTGPVDLYDVLDRVSCWCCRNKNLKELRAVYTYLPEYWSKLKNLQSRLDEPMKGRGKSVFDLERRFDIENQWIQEGKKIGTKEFYRALKLHETEGKENAH